MSREGLVRGRQGYDCTLNMKAFIQALLAVAVFGIKIEFSDKSGVQWGTVNPPGGVRGTTP